MKSSAFRWPNNERMAVLVTVMFEVWSEGKAPPYALDTPKGRLVAIAHSDFMDNRTLRASPRDFYNVYKDTFDYLYQHETPSIINLTVHAHFGGRPLMSAMLHELLHYMKGFSGVWFARHDEVARWVLKQR